ncbi:hypothetical protein ASPBRDRAFT_42627 [Aspergillus brasiliensis CBS 101740]|uniref:Uncharacterized protein n=1 Tax=Aspergillus brasiliensis (strain CBS 101740 / IMI 381727 / IBT 21946) TaxID=767769 RepID=A0A1L9UMF8_ASPBC|nr:hypothetical protein ASPBRDRAFT_42627 [Aspergillus brasiliensis CBS 101740]
MLVVTCYESIVDPKEARDTDVMGSSPRQKENRMSGILVEASNSPGGMVSTAPARGEIQGRKRRGSKPGDSSF